jgi:NAD(P)-dependent dehydrogenase (short-subunit alcohol dehydrogenase family)
MSRTSTKRSQGSSAIVTGAGSGIGAAFAIELAARGGRVVCSDIDVAAAQRTVDAITARGGSAAGMRCDVSRIDDVHALAEQSQEWFGGPPTLVVNNAGVVVGGRQIGEAPLDDWSWAVSINLWGPIHGCHVFAPVLRAAGYGGIINVASAAAFGASPNLAVYSVTKAAVLSLSETLAAELNGSGVTVTALCPTFVKTNIMDSGRLTVESAERGGRAMKLTGISPDNVVRKCLNAHDRGRMYCFPQLDAKVGWRITRLAPAAYTRALGLVHRFSAPQSVAGRRRLSGNRTS